MKTSQQPPAAGQAAELSVGAALVQAQAALRTAASRIENTDPDLGAYLHAEATKAYEPIRRGGKSRRTVQELADDYGWGTAHTGGGCTALEKDFGKHFAYITAIDSPETPDTPNEECVLGFYTHAQEDAEPVMQFRCPDLETAMKMADMLEDGK